MALSLSASFLTAGCGLASNKTAAKTENKPALTQEQQTKKAEANMSAARNTPIVQAAKKVGPAVVGITNKAWYGITSTGPSWWNRAAVPE